MNLLALNIATDNIVISKTGKIPLSIGDYFFLYNWSIINKQKYVVKTQNITKFPIN